MPQLQEATLRAPDELERPARNGIMIGPGKNACQLLISKVQNGNQVIGPTDPTLFDLTIGRHVYLRSMSFWAAVLGPSSWMPVAVGHASDSLTAPAPVAVAAAPVNLWHAPPGVH